MTLAPRDVPDLTPRPLELLAIEADKANEGCSQANYSLAGRDVGVLLAESQASALTISPAERDRAFTAAVTACFVAGVVSSRAGNIDLAATAARRGYDLAQQQDNPGLLGFARWYWACELFDFARLLAQEGGPRDGDAIRHLDMADRLAPQRIRNDPIARDLVVTLDRRAHRRAWELDSLRNRFGVGAPGLRSGDN